MWNSFFSINTHWHFPSTAERQKESIGKTMTGETIQTYWELFRRRWCIESDSSTATTSFWSGFIPINIVLFMTYVNTKPILNTSFTVHKILRKIQKTCTTYTQNISPILPLGLKSNVDLMNVLYLRSCHWYSRWGLNFAFYLRCSHIGQQRMNLRQDIIKRIECGDNDLALRPCPIFF